MNKQQLMVFMDWVESSIDLKIAESFDRSSEYEYIKEINLRDKLLGLFQVDAKAIRAESLEEAAKVCDARSHRSDDMGAILAAAIRGLK